MARVAILRFVAVLTIFAAYQNDGLVTALRLEVSPPVVNEMVTEEVSLTCSATHSPYWTAKVVVMEIGKIGERPLAILRHPDVTLSPDATANMEADGVIDTKNATASFIRLRIKNPVASDAGVYSCEMFYIDGFGQIKEGRVYANLTVDNEDHKVILAHILGKVKALEKTVKDQGTQLASQGKQLNECRNESVAQDKRIQDQHVQAKKQHAKDQLAIDNLHSLITDYDTTQKAQQESIARLNTSLTDSSLNVAFSAKYEKSYFQAIDTTLLFRNSTLNLGNAYDSRRSIFTAPRAGLYVFYLSAMTAMQGFKVQVDLRVNTDETLIALHSIEDQNKEQSSVSAIASLQAGDQVRPVLTNYYGNTLNNEGKYSVFSGYLLKPL